MKKLLTMALWLLPLGSWSQTATNTQLQLWVGETLMNEGATAKCSQTKEEWGIKILTPNIAVENLSDKTVTLVVTYSVNKIDNGTLLVCGGEDMRCMSVDETGKYQTYILNLAPNTKELLDFKMSIPNSDVAYTLDSDLQIEQLTDGCKEYKSTSVVARGVKARMVAGTAISTGIDKNLTQQQTPAFYHVYDLQGNRQIQKASKEVCNSLKKGVFLCVACNENGKVIKSWKLVK